MIVNGIDLDTIPKEKLTPLQVRVLIAQARVQARDFALQLFRRPINR